MLLIGVARVAAPYKALTAETMPVTIVTPVMVVLYVPAVGAC